MVKGLWGWGAGDCHPPQAAARIRLCRRLPEYKGREQSKTGDEKSKCQFWRVLRRERGTQTPTSLIHPRTVDPGNPYSVIQGDLSVEGVERDWPSCGPPTHFAHYPNQVGL